MFCSFSLIIGYLGKSMFAFKGVSPVVTNMMLKGKIHQPDHPANPTALMRSNGWSGERGSTVYHY